jgi:hypothetical protein
MAVVMIRSGKRRLGNEKTFWPCTQNQLEDQGIDVKTNKDLGNGWEMQNATGK